MHIGRRRGNSCMHICMQPKPTHGKCMYAYLKKPNHVHTMCDLSKHTRTPNMLRW